MQKKSPTNTHRYLADSGWLTIDKCVARKYSIRIDDIEESVYAAMCERSQQIEIAHKQKEAPDIETESIKELRSKKAELERKLQTKSRKRKAINTKPLTGPFAM